MKTLGIDLASSPLKTGVCVIAWKRGEAVVEELRIGADDDELILTHERVDVTGIDAPFGWPVPFVELLSDAEQRLTKPWTNETRDELRFRLTDFRVHEMTGRWPLSVSTDLIGVTALRCAGLLDRMGVADRSGDGEVYEVYPSAALKVWGLQSTGYKGGKKLSALAEIWNDLAQRAPWLCLRDQNFMKLLTTRDDAFDALIAAFVARAAKMGLTTSPSDEDRQRAFSEGWIHVPVVGPLSGIV